MKIALAGYGKMGKTIEQVALERGHEISYKISSINISDWEKISATNTDLVIEFSKPDTVLKNMQHCFDKNIPIVVGTTGWYKELKEVEKVVNRDHKSLLYASNFSIGVNLFFTLNKELSKIMSSFSQYNASIEEIHHIQKLDKPSGTAITLAEGIVENHKKYNSWKLDEVSEPNELLIRSVRSDEVPGTHIIQYESEIDLLEIKHEAKSRMGFALGSIIAAEWLLGKQGFFNISDVLKVNIG